MRYFQDSTGYYFATDDVIKKHSKTQRIRVFGRHYQTVSQPILFDWVENRYFDTCTEVLLTEVLKDNRSEPLLKYIAKYINARPIHGHEKYRERIKSFQKDLREAFNHKDI